MAYTPVLDGFAVESIPAADGPSTKRLCAYSAALRAFCTSCQTALGVSGRSRGSTPNELSASATALATTPPTEMMPPSPAPLAPSGLIGDGCDSIIKPRMLGKSLAVGTR